MTDLGRQRRVLVTDGETRAALAVARGLHAAGFEVAVAAAESSLPAAGHWSRSARERLTVPQVLDDEVGFVDAIAKAVTSGRYDSLIVSSDASLLAVSRGRDRLTGHVSLGLPPHATVGRALDKTTLASIASDHELASPPAIMCSGLVEGRAAARQLGYPVLVKPTSSIVDRGTSRNQLGSARATDDRSLELAVDRCGERYLIQQCEKGPILSFAGVYAGGQLLAEALSQYWRTWYPEAGNVSFSETVGVPPELRERVTGLLDKIGWKGLFELELIRRHGGGWAAIDFNPRAYGSLALAIGAGANLPALWCEYVLTGSAKRAQARPGVRYRWEDADLRYALWYLRRGELAKAAPALRVHRRVVHSYFRLGDPGPLAARTLWLAKVMRRRISPRRPPAAQDVRDPGVREQVPTSTRRGSALPVAIIGAGPYGLAAAAHLRAESVPVHCFGRPLELWRQHMPAGMLLRSPRPATNIASPHRSLDIEVFERTEGRALRTPTLRLDEFIDYGMWFQRRVVPDIDTRQVLEVGRDDGSYAVRLEDGEEVRAARVVVAAGPANFASHPEPFAQLPPSVVSHTSNHVDLGTFSNKRVLVIGAGQSALESAALLHEAGATVEVLVRAPAVHWLADDTLPVPVRSRIVVKPPTGVGGALTGWVAAAPDSYRWAPSRTRAWVSERCLRPAGSGWLRPRLADVPITCGRFVTQVATNGGDVRLLLNDGSERSADHVLLGTGYDVDVKSYPFLAPLVPDIATVAGHPLLGPGLESSLPGLHFLGAPATLSFGPIMRFVVGSWYAAPALTLRVLGRRQLPLRLSF